MATSSGTYRSWTKHTLWYQELFTLTRSFADVGGNRSGQGEVRRRAGGRGGYEVEREERRKRREEEGRMIKRRKGVGLEEGRL